MENPCPPVAAIVPEESAPGEGRADPGAERPWELLAPAEQTAPVVFASPHSGRTYSKAFIEASRLDALTLRRSEDAFMDEVFATVVKYGAPLFSANFPRAYVDANREAFELDPAMFTGPLPAYVNTASSRVAAGLGTIARVVTSGDEIYRDKLRFEDTKQRIEDCHGAYHQALKDLIDATRRTFGGCLLVDCHSMPSVGGPMDQDPGLRRVDAVLGDCHGTACAPAITDLAEARLKSEGLVVTRNNPYAGGFTTRHYGTPKKGVHALQIEVNRSLYMDEATVTRAAGLSDLARRLEPFLAGLTELDPAILAPR